MIYITRKHLKPGMIIAKDVFLYGSNNVSSFLLAKGQVLNSTYINRINYHNLDGAYIENELFSDINLESYIDEKLKAKSLKVISETYYELQASSGKVNANMIKELSSVVNNIVTELLNKEDLTYNLIDFKNYDTYTFQHSLNVAMLSISTGISMQLSESKLNEIGMAAVLHDIGKMLIPIEILNKPEKLTYEEYEIMKEHPMNAVNQLKNMVPYEVLRAIEDHHEKLDGTGYPNRKRDRNISFYAKILAVSDVYDALTSDRPYRKAVFPNEVVEYLMGSVDKHFDYTILNRFLKIIFAYPVGTFVKLSNQKLAVVIKNHTENILRPVVRIINSDGTVGEDIDLLSDPNYMNITIVDMGYDYENYGLIGILKSSMN
ncbi:MAG: HD-GYP domain-containing protein [Tissierellia bacterium]|jgi:HD-GYP domain-containing protein (c-di-GMP phosphodiesterase class II)|nr:HD-GYP domain-containing protein [Tissierellia bacterium]